MIQLTCFFADVGRIFSPFHLNLAMVSKLKVKLKKKLKSKPTTKPDHSTSKVIRRGTEFTNHYHNNCSLPVYFMSYSYWFLIPEGLCRVNELFVINIA